MAIAAVPKYLGTDFSSAAPGHRFGMYLRLWGTDARSKETLWTTHDVNYRTAGQNREERAFKDENKTPALREALRLNQSDSDTMAALARRQSSLARAIGDSGQLLSLDAEAIAPFTTGLGNEHPLENGFAFLNPYGLPYLPGSGVKGVLRKAAQELEKGLFGGKAGWTPGAIEALFGRESDSHDTEHQRGALMFWDVIPQIKGDSLKVEVMTPHQGHYYQKGESPHESGSPNPINFLTVPPGSSFTFHIQCNRHFLARIAPELANDGRWKSLLEAAFTHAFEWLGFGAKTRVGYGSMHDMTAELARQRGIEREERERLQRAENERAAQAEAEQLRKAALSAAQLEIEELESVLRERQWQGPRSISLPHQKPYQLLEGLLKRALAADSTWSAPERQTLAQLLKDLTAVSPPRLSDNSKLGKDAKKLINQLLAAKP